jgi:hypothetical protein
LADPIQTDCQSDYVRAKSKCFDNLFESLVEAGNDAQKQAEARDRYRTCLKLCKAAKAMCEAESA